MRSDNRLSRVLHVLIHLHEQEAPITSEKMAQMLSINAVVMRRTMAGLREKGYVQSEKGHGGGWMLSKPLEEINLRDVYHALGDPPIFALGLAEDQPECLVEQAVNEHLSGALEDAKNALLKRFATLTLADIARDFEVRLHKPGSRSRPGHRSH